MQRAQRIPGYLATTMKYLLPVATFLMTAISCSNTDDLASFINEDPKKYNDKIQEWSAGGEHWTNDPLIITRELFRSADFERRVILAIKGQTKDKVTVTITREGLEDDSVDGEMSIIEFERTNNLWTIQ